MPRLLRITLFMAACAAAFASSALAAFPGPDERIAYPRFTGIADLADL
jgi:hypothetical protein